MLSNAEKKNPMGNIRQTEKSYYSVVFTQGHLLHDHSKYLGLVLVESLFEIRSGSVIFASPSLWVLCLLYLNLLN